MEVLNIKINTVTLTSKDLGKRLSHEIEDAIYDILVDQGVGNDSFNWKLVVSIDEYPDDEESTS